MRTSHVWKIEYSGNPLGVYVLADSAAEALQIFATYCETEQRRKQEKGAPPAVFSCVRVLSDVITGEII